MMHQDSFIRLKKILAEVPAGTITSYGQLARLAGMGRQARQVGRWLSTSPDPSLPWYRVLRSGGQLPFDAHSSEGKRFVERLQEEGIVITGNRVNWQKYAWLVDSTAEDGWLTWAEHIGLLPNAQKN